MTKWEKLGRTTPRLKPLIQEGLRFAYIHYAKMDRTKAYVVYMCEYARSSNSTSEHLILCCPVINPRIKLMWIRNNWDADYITDAESKIKETVR